MSEPECVPFADCRVSYGHLGRAILVRLFQNLLKWGLLPTLASRADSPSPIQPLSPSDFICQVLVPEAAVFLIMEDRGYKSDGLARSATWDEDRAGASHVRKESVEYGRWKFRGDGPDAEDILEELDRRESDVRRPVKRVRGSGLPRRVAVSRNKVASDPNPISDDDSIGSLPTASSPEPAVKRRRTITTPDTDVSAATTPSLSSVFSPSQRTDSCFLSLV